MIVHPGFISVASNNLSFVITDFIASYAENMNKNMLDLVAALVGSENEFNNVFVLDVYMYYLISGPVDRLAINQIIRP